MVYFNRKSIEIMLEFGKNDTVIKAGSPINFNGEVANDATAIGLLLKDVRRTGYRAGKVITSGVVSLEAAEAASGITLSDAAKAAMSNIEFASGSGSGLPEVTGSGKALVSINGEWKEMDGYGYSEGESVETIANETVTATSFGPGAMATFASAFELVVGDTYNVVMDNVTYSSLVATSLSSFVVITDGNVETAEGATFSIVYTELGSSQLQFGDASKVGDHTVKVEHITEVAHKIDSKYLPAKELPAYPTEDGSYVLTCTIASGVATLEWKAAESAG